MDSEMTAEIQALRGRIAELAIREKSQKMSLARANPEPEETRDHNGTSQAIQRCGESLEKLYVLVDILDGKLKSILLPSEKELVGVVDVPSGVCPIATSIHQLAVRANNIIEMVERMTKRIDL